jgi:hypothetical protein
MPQNLSLLHKQSEPSFVNSALFMSYTNRGDKI